MAGENDLHLIHFLLQWCIYSVHAYDAAAMFLIRMSSASEWSAIHVVARVILCSVHLSSYRNCTNFALLLIPSSQEDVSEGQKAAFRIVLLLWMLTSAVRRFKFQLKTEGLWLVTAPYLPSWVLWLLCSNCRRCTWNALSKLVYCARIISCLYTWSVSWYAEFAVAHIALVS